MPDLIRSHRGQGRTQRVRIITDDELAENGGDYTVDPDHMVVRSYGGSIQDNLPVVSSQLSTIDLARPVYLVTQEQIDSGEYVLDTAGYANVVEVDPDQDVDGTVAIPILQGDGEWLNRYPCMMLQPLEADFSGLSTREEELADIVNRTGCRMVMQFVDTTVTSGEVDQFLDTCQLLGIQAVMAFEEDMPYSGTWDLTDYNNIMAPNASHPAFVGFRSIDEPFGAGFTTVQIQQLYTQLKTSTPNMPLVIQWSSEIRVYQNVPTKQYAAGMCDIAMFTRLPFRDDPSFNYIDDVEDGQSYTRWKVSTTTPGVPLWTTVQAIGGGAYRTPSIGEFQDLYNIMASDRLASIAPVEVICWQNWATLRDPNASNYCNFIKRVASTSGTDQELFIDNENGNDTTGDGSSGTPYKTLGKALTVVVPHGTIYARGSSSEATIYYESNLTLSDGFVTLKADTGHSPVFTPSVKYTSWALTSGSVYETAYTPNAAYGVWNGATKLTSTASVVACEALVDSFYFDNAGNKLHVHITGGGAPSQINAISDVNTLVADGASGIGATYDGITIQWCARGLAYSAVGPLTVENCTFRYMTDAVGSRAAIQVTGGSNHFIANCSISGFYHATTGTQGVLIQSPASSVTVTDCLITSCRYGIVQTATGTTGHLFKHNIIWNVNDGIDLVAAAAFTARHNLIYEFEHGAIRAQDASTIAVIHHNIAYCPAVPVRAHNFGYIVDPDATVALYHNIAYGMINGSGNGRGFYASGAGATVIAANNISMNNKFGWTAVTAPTITSDYNCTYGNVTEQYDDWAQGAHDITVDPLFTNASGQDFTIMSGSPCINAGVVISGINNDYLGDRPDIGVYEKA